jgi:hypothetical protein
MADDRDPCSEFQRAFSALGVTHLVAPSPQAKGKIERRFGTLQKRLVAILAYEKVDCYAAAQIVLAREVERQNATVCRTTGLSPNAAWEKALAGNRTATRPCPPATLLDLHLALHLKRRVNTDNQIDFLEPVINFLKEMSVLCIYTPALSWGWQQNEKVIRVMSATQSGSFV